MADEKDGAAEAESSGGKMKMIMIGGGAVALLAVGIFAGPAIQNMISPPPEEAVDAAVVEPTSGPELYEKLHPAMVINLRDEFGDPHFMQVDMEVMARDQDTINAVRDHTPLIRNNLILLYTSFDFESVLTRDGKEKMLADGLAAVQEVLESRIKTPNVEALYFTSLIIQ